MTKFEIWYLYLEIEICHNNVIVCHYLSNLVKRIVRIFGQMTMECAEFVSLNTRIKTRDTEDEIC